nr:cytochrome c oxidase subunit 6b-3-like [Halyomorpha halys]
MDQAHLSKNVVEIDGMICAEIEKEPEIEGIVISTCPPDPRFQQTNKTKWCYRMFIDFHRCAYLLGEDSGHCKLFEKCYKCLCPNEWINNWNEQIENGTFPRDLTKEMGK